MMYSVARTELIKVGALLGAVLLILFGINYGLSMQIASSEDELAKLNAQVLQVKSKLSEITIERKSRDEARAFYQTYSTSESAKPENFVRESAKSTIASMRKQFGLNSIQLNNTGFKEVKTPLSTPESVALNSYATVRFTASYDIPVYDLIATIEDSLPGVVTISSVNIKKTAEANDAAISRITSGQEVSLVSGDISFNWFGVVDPNLRVVSKPEISEDDHMGNLENIFGAMGDVAGQENNSVVAAPVQPQTATPKLKPITGVAPVKKLGDIKSVSMAPVPAKPSQAAANIAPRPSVIEPSPMGGYAVQKLQAIQPQNTMPAVPAQPHLPDAILRKKGGSNEN